MLNRRGVLGGLVVAAGAVAAGAGKLEKDFPRVTLDMDTTGQFVPCDGRQLLIENHPELYAVLGRKYDLPDDVAPLHFRVPYLVMRIGEGEHAPYYICTKQTGFWVGCVVGSIYYVNPAQVNA